MMLQQAHTRGMPPMPRSRPSAADHLAYEELASFRHELRTFLEASEGMARRAGLEPQQYHLLLAIKAHQREANASIKDLSEQLVLRHHSVVELIDRLEVHGLVERHRQAGDRRKVSVVLTRKGERIVASLATRHTQILRETGGQLASALASVLDKTRMRQPPSARPTPSR